MASNLIVASQLIMFGVVVACCLWRCVACGLCHYLLLCLSSRVVKSGHRRAAGFTDSLGHSFASGWAGDAQQRWL